MAQVRASGYAVSIAQKWLGVARWVEPQLSELIKQIAQELDGELIGFEYRMKTAASLERKIAQVVRRSQMSLLSDGTGSIGAIDPQAVLMKLDDVLRFTLVLPEERYTSGVRHARETLVNVSEDEPGLVGDIRQTISRAFERFRTTWRGQWQQGPQGHGVEGGAPRSSTLRIAKDRYKNYWFNPASGASSTYQGINDVYQIHLPTGDILRFEVQYHTAESSAPPSSTPRTTSSGSPPR